MRMSNEKRRKIKTNLPHEYKPEAEYQMFLRDQSLQPLICHQHQPLNFVASDHDALCGADDNDKCLLIIDIKNF